MIQKPKGTYDVINGNKIIVIENILQELMDK